MAQEFQLQQSPNRVNPSGTATVPGYIEGLWTPSVGGTATYTAQTGNFTRIGNRVFINCVIAINTIGTGSTTVVSGLPYSGHLATPLYIASTGAIATSVVSLAAMVQTGAKTIIILSRTAAATQDLNNDIFKDGASLFIAGQYYTFDTL